MRKAKALKECENAPNCPELFSADSDHTKCPKCRQRLAAWLKRPAYDVMRYVTSLKLRTARMESVTDERDIAVRPMFYNQ